VSTIREPGGKAGAVILADKTASGFVAKLHLQWPRFLRLSAVSSGFSGQE
jgi:hypothetical protein